jgi:outer membrane protein TolC
MIVKTAWEKYRQGLSHTWCCQVLCFMLVSIIYTAPAAQGARWTLEQCLEQALSHNPEVNEARLEIRIAESQLTQARAGRLPQVTYTSINGIVNGARGDAVSGETDDDDLGPFTKGDLEVIQPLYTFGRLQHEVRAAALGVETKQAATKKVRDAVVATVKELYYNLVLSRQSKNLLTEVQEHFTKALETAEQRLEAGEGTVTQQDILKLRIGLTGVTKETYTLERAVAVTKEALMYQLGLSPKTDFEIADTDLEPVILQLQPLDAYLEQADKHRPELAQLEAGLAARQARLQALRSMYYPSLFLAGGIRYAVAPNRDNQDNPFVNDEFNYFNAGMALGLRWKLDFWMTRAKETERLAELAKTETQKENATQGIELDIKRRYLEVQETQQKIEAAQTARKAARALLVTTLANFGLGVGDAKDVFDSIGLYTRIVSDYYTAVRDYNLAAARLSQATGQETTTLSYQHKRP